MVMDSIQKSKRRLATAAKKAAAEHLGGGRVCIFGGLVRAAKRGIAIAAIDSCKGNQTKAAQLLCIDRLTLKALFTEEELGNMSNVKRENVKRGEDMRRTIPVIRADIPPLGETYSDGAKVQAMATGELVTLSIEFCQSDKALAIMTVDQAERLADALKYAAINADARRLPRY